MPNIGDILGDGVQTGVEDFDLDKFLSEADGIIANHSSTPAPETVPPAEGEPSPAGSGPVATTPGSGEEPEPDTGAAATSPPSAPVSAPDPLAELPADRTTVVP